MKQCIIIISLAFVCSLTFLEPILAKEDFIVRGRLVREINDRDQKILEPVANIPVTMNQDSLGRSVPAYSDRTGMFYFFNLPLGEYTIEVWVNGRIDTTETPQTRIVTLKANISSAGDTLNYCDLPLFKMP